MKALIIGIALSLVWLGGTSAQPQEAAVIRATMKSIWEKPDSLLTVEPIAVAENFALADWDQGEMGGRALLRKKGGNWEVLLCAGDEIKGAKALGSAGVPAEIARRLADDLARAEAKLSRARLEKFSSFKGLVRMEQAGHPRK